MQMQIFDLAYQGKDREKKIAQLNERNGFVKYETSPGIVRCCLVEESFPTLLVVHSRLHIVNIQIMEYLTFNTFC